MKLFDKAFEILQTEEFNRSRILAARKLYNLANGREKEMIGRLFESQYARAKEPGDIMWLNSLK